jgi:hypothetical protein
VKIAAVLPLPVGAALLASAEGYTPRANGTLDRAREELGPIHEIAAALAESLPAPKAPARKSRRRRRKKKPAEAETQAATTAAAGEAPEGVVDAATEAAADTEPVTAEPAADES